jgi:L-ascorbate metabolism protein UlaG (beta-lactamase superfamily)
MTPTISLPRQQCAITVLGGPTTVIDLGGLRIVTDPTFDEPGPHGYLTKSAGPAADEAAVGPAALVLVSHAQHADNLDARGRAFAQTAGLILTGPTSAALLGAPALGLAPWSSHALPRANGGGDLTVLAVPAVHGPEDGERDADGNVNCAVTGFVLSGRDLPTVYISGDNASIRTVAEISRRVPPIDVAVLHAGSARVPAKFDGRPLSLTVAAPPPQQRDRFQIITEHDADHVIALDAGLDFQRSDALVMIQVFTQKGRTSQVKQHLYRTIADKLEHLGVTGEDVFISIMENTSHDWSFGYGHAQYSDGTLPIPGS